MKLNVLFATTCLAAWPALVQAADQPNILLIIADDMGLDASTCYDVGNQQAKMPNIQAMCDSGMVFENAYSAPGLHAHARNNHDRTIQFPHWHGGGDPA